MAQPLQLIACLEKKVMNVERKLILDSDSLHNGAVFEINPST